MANLFKAASEIYGATTNPWAWAYGKVADRTKLPQLGDLPVVGPVSKVPSKVTEELISKPLVGLVNKAFGPKSRPSKPRKPRKPMPFGKRRKANMNSSLIKQRQAAMRKRRQQAKNAALRLR
jgi:hypothetical protein|tara:strand:+ start:483 stop:848 length:366 start_codon:yes stop_codon:yes gene_type:complete